MMWNGTTRLPGFGRGMYAGRAATALAVALLAGCGGGGGGGGGTSGGGGGGGGAQVIATKLVRADQAGDNNFGPNSTVAIGTASGANITPEVDVLGDSAPVGGVTITIQTDPSPPAVPGTFTQAGTVYDIQPAGTVFRNGGLIIKIPYLSTISPANAQVLQLYYFDVTTSSWQALANQQIDTTNHVISGTASQIAAGRATGQADYVVLGPPSLPPPPL